MFIDLCRTADLQDNPVAHDRNTVRHCHGLFLVMCDIHKGDPELLLKALQLYLHLLAQLQVQSAQRLIQEQDTRVVDQRTGDGHALFLPAGECVRPALFVPGHLYQSEHFLNLLPNLIFRHFADGRTVCDVVIDTHMREKRVVLKNGVYIALIGLFFFDALALHLDDPVARVFKTGNHSKRSSLSASGRSQQSKKLSLPDLQVHIFDDMIAAIPFVDMLNRNNRI